MKKRFLISSLALAASVLLTSPENVTKAETVVPYGAGGWDKIGTWTFSNMIRFRSGGGDLKVCVNNSTSKIKFGIKRSIIGTSREATTSGGSNNCAIWRDIGGSGYVDLFFADDNHPSSVNVTVYD